MLSKFIAIIQKELYLTFMDRNTVLLMFAVPLAIATIVGAAFSGLSGGGTISFDPIPIALVNLDEGVEMMGQPQDFGANFVAIVTGEGDGAPMGEDTPSCTLTSNDGETQQQGSLSDLLNATVLDTPEAARAAVETGEYDVAVIIPADFSASLSPAIDMPGSDDAQNDASSAADVRVYANSAQSINGAIVRGIVQGYVNTLVTGNIAIETTINTLIDSNPLVASVAGNNDAANAVMSCGFGNTLATVTLDQQVVSAGDADAQAEDTQEGPQLNAFSQILIMVGTAQAFLFALFAAQFGIISVVDERREGTMQRMLASPTPRWLILAAKFGGTLVMVILQLLILMLALSAIASVGSGEPVWLWGNNIILLLLLVILTSTAVCGLGVLMSGIARTPEQVGTLGSVVNIMLGIVSGAFGFAAILPVAYLSMIYWGVDGLQKLSNYNNDIGLNLLVLAIQSLVLFGIGTWLFNRRVEA